MSTIPNEQECLDILRGQGASDRVIKHVCTVMVLAVAIGEKCGADIELVRAGGLLHDLGRTRTHGIRHAVEGAFIARSLHLPEPLVLIIQKHIWAGMTPQEAAEVGLPDLDYMPSSIEEKIVCHADNLVGDASYLTSRESYQDFVRKGFESTGKRMLAMHQELSALCGQDIDEIVKDPAVKTWNGPCSHYIELEIKKWD